MRQDKELFMSFGDFGAVKAKLVADRHEEYVVRVENAEYVVDAIIPKAQARLSEDGIYVKARLFTDDIDMALAGILLGSLLKEVGK